MLVDNIEIKPRQQRQLVEPAHFLVDTTDATLDHYGVPLAQTSYHMVNDNFRRENDAIRIGDTHGFSGLNTGCRQGSNYTIDFLGENLSPEDGTQQETVQRFAPSAIDQQAQARPKRKSKYEEEAPISVYGPPFSLREIRPGMSEDEIHGRIMYNDAAAEARKNYMRHKNNLAAKKSRERKQALIDQLTMETQNLSARLRQMRAENRELADSTNRVHSVENDNIRLRQENEVLRGKIEDLTRRLDGLTVERQRDADRLNAMLSLSHSQNPTPMAVDQEITPDSGQQGHYYPEEQKQVEPQKRPEESGDVINSEIDQLLSGLNDDGHEPFHWDGFL